MLGLYQLNSSSGNFEALSEGTFLDPLSVQVTPTGRASVKKVWIRNDDASKYYTNIKLTPLSLGGQPLNPSISIQFIVGSTKPKPSEWDGAPTILLPNQIGSLRDIGSDVTGDTKYYPFWMKTSVVAPIELGEIRSQVEISYTEAMVG